MSFNWVHHEFQLGPMRRTNYGLPVVSPTDLVAEAKRIGEDVAGKWADAVDREARFPAETIDALGASGLLGALIPAEWAERGATLPQASQAVSAVSRETSRWRVRLWPSPSFCRPFAICGLNGYRNDSERSLTRSIRDVLAAPLVVNNDSSLQGNAQSLLVRKES